MTDDKGNGDKPRIPPDLKAVRPLEFSNPNDLRDCCVSCKCYSPDKKIPKQGQCRRDPPVVRVLMTVDRITRQPTQIIQTIWPIVTDDGWCRKQEPKDKG